MYYSDELYHHGIKGQRWGRRNGPPYPLSPQTHASVVRSAGRGGSTGSKSTKKGKIGGVKEHLLANGIFDKSDTGREAYRENLKANAKSAVGTGIGAGVGAGIGAGVAALRKGNIKEGAVYGGLAGSALGSLAGTRSYIKSLKLGAKRHKEIREADRAKKGRIGGMTAEEEKAARRKRILRNVAIGAGAAAALGGAGYLAYRNRDALVRYARTAGAKGRQGLTQARLGAKRVRYAAKDNINKILFKGKNAANAAGNVVGNSANAVATSAKAAGKSAQTAARMASARARQEAVQARLAAKRARYAAKDISNKAAFETSKAVSNAAKSVGSTAANTGRGIRDIFNRGTSSAATAGRTAVAKGRQGLTQARLDAKRVRYAAKDIGGRAAFKTARFYRNNPWAIPASALGAAAVGGTAYGIARSRRRKKKRSSRR